MTLPLLRWALEGLRLQVCRLFWSDERYLAEKRAANVRLLKSLLDEKQRRDR